MNLKTGSILALLCSFLSLVPGQAMAKQKLSLDEFLNLVRKESLDLAIESATVDAAKFRASGIRIPPGMVGVMQMQDGSDSGTGFEAFQEIPFPTKIAQEKKTRKLEYQNQKQMSEIQKTMVMTKARLAYMEFWASAVKLNVLREKVNWLHHHQKLFRTTLFSDNEAKVHLLGIESETDLLRNDILDAEATLLEKRNVLNNFSPSLQGTDIVPLESAMGNQKFDETKSPLVTWKEKELELKKAKLNLAKQSYVPDLSVRFRSFNGMEMSSVDRELMVGITVPFLYFWQSQAEVKGAHAEKIKSDTELQKMIITAESMRSSLIKKVAALRSQILNLKNTLIPRAAQRVELMKNISPRTMQGLDEHKMVMSDYLDLKMKAVDLRVEYEKNLQEILQLTGNQ